jgi:GNAT superfamily N-acetyltransferase
MKKRLTKIFSRISISKIRPVLRFFLLLFAILITVAVSSYATQKDVFGIQYEASMGLFGVVVSMLGALFVAFELNNSEKTNRCATLSDLNMKFIENDKLMNLYQELSRCAQDPDYKLHVDNSDKDAVHSADLMGYMTFYEVINEFVSQGVMDIAQMDDMFGDRFFKLVHNEYVQEHELYTEPSSYVNIFELYATWKEHRRNEAKKNKNRVVVLAKNEIPDLYLEKKLYLQERLQQFHERSGIKFSRKNNETDQDETIELDLRRLFPTELKEFEILQEETINRLGNDAIFKESLRDEILESMLIDYCYGLYDGDRLVAQCICVLNRQTSPDDRENERNLCIYVNGDEKNYSDYLTYDSIQVAEGYEGFGIQNFFIKEAEKLAEDAGARYLIATVSPDNSKSKNNFTESGFEILRTMDKYGAKRCLVRKPIVQAGRE